LHRRVKLVGEKSRVESRGIMSGGKRNRRPQAAFVM
jgi:hypothetical protein